MKDLSRISLNVTLLGAGLFLFGASAFGKEAASPAYSGSLRATYDYRGMGDYEDHDAYSYWYFRGRDLGDELVDIYTSGRFHSDLDGTTSTAYDPFGSISDGSQGDFRLLQFYVDIHNREQSMAMRYGRQYVDIADYIQLDGAQVMLFEKQAIGGRVFIGQPASDYSATDGDVFLGASLVGRPWSGNQSRATYARYRDDSKAVADDHVFLNMKQTLGDELRTHAYLSVMNNDVRMGGADLFYVSMSDYVFDAVLGVKRWGDYTADTRAYSPLSEALNGLEPYTMGYGRFTAELLPWLYLSPGATLREPDDENFTNRRFERYDLSFILEPTDGLSSTVALEYWDVDDDSEFFGVSGDIRYRYRKLWELSLGAAYVDYTYLQLSDQSVFNNDEAILPELPINPQDGSRVEASPNAFTYYLRGRWSITEKAALRLSGELEDDSDEEDLSYRIRTSFEVRL